MSQLATLVGVIKTFKNWPLQILDYLNLLPAKPVVFRLRNGMKFKARTRTLDGMVIREVWTQNDYTPAGFEIAPDAVVLEVGGHVGSFSVMAANRAKAGHVYVFEPSPENFALLQENLRLNGVGNATVYNLALLGRGGTREIALAPNMVSNSLVVDLPGAVKVKVEGTSLADFLEQAKVSKVHFMKLDCEGAEHEIFAECPGDVLARIEKISAEVHDLDAGRNRETLKKLLESKGFAVVLDPSKPQMLYARR